MAYSSSVPRIEGTHRQRIIDAFKGEMLSHYKLSLGFGFFWIWIWIVFQNDLLGRIAEFGFVRFSSWAIALLSYAIGFFVLGLLFKMRRIVPRGRFYLLGILFCMSFGALLMLLSESLGASSSVVSRALAIASSFLMGIGTSGLHVEWGRVFGNRGTRATVIHGIAGTLFAAMIYVVLCVLPTQVLQLCTPILPIFCLWPLGKILRGDPRLYERGVNAMLFVPWKFIATSLIQGLSFGVMWSALLLADQGGSIMLVNAGSFSLAAVGVCMAALLFKMDFNHLIYQVGFLAMSIGYVLLAFSECALSLGSLVNSVGCHFMSILMWALCVYLIENRNISANWVFTWTTGAYILGQALGAVIAGSVLDPMDGIPSSLSMLAAAMVFVILASALLMLSNNNLRTGWGMVRPSESDLRSDVFDVACKIIGSEYGLTPREIEILVPLSKGRNRSVIGDQLLLSPNTVKTHIRNIYQKTGIHSQQELIDLVEQEAKPLTYEDDPSPTTAF